MSKKRKMVDFRINEISAVDDPAQAHAKLVLVKRNGGEGGGSDLSLTEKRAELAESIAKMYIDPSNGALTFAEVLDLEMQEKDFYEVMDAVCPIIYAMETSLKSIAGDQSLEVSQKLTMMRETVEGFMSTIRAKWEGMDDFMYDVARKLEEEPIMANKTHKQLIDEVADLTAQLEAAKSASSGETDTKELDALKSQVDELTKKLEAVETEKADAIAKASMTDAEREFHTTLKGDDAADFLKMAPKARSSYMKTMNDNDDTIVIGGRTIRKSSVGEDAFEVMKAQEARLAETEKQAAKDRDERITTELTKRADTDLNHLPGTTAEKVTLLKAVSALGSEERATLDKILKASNDAMSGAFTRLGHGGGNITSINKGREVVKDGEHPFMQKVNEIKKNEKIKGSEAMIKARNLYPDDYRDFAGKDDADVA